MTSFLLTAATLAALAGTDPQRVQTAGMAQLNNPGDVCFNYIIVGGKKECIGSLGSSPSNTPNANPSSPQPGKATLRETMSDTPFAW